MTAGTEPGLPDGYSLIALGEIDSTNAEALRRARDGAGAGTLVCARTQSQGRGRKGATWVSPPGNLYASLIVKPPRERLPGQLAFVAAVAAGEAICELAPVSGSLRYKWPNDLLLDGRKLGGILIEGGPPGLYIIGLGVNLMDAPTNADIAGVSLHSVSGVDIAPDTFLAAFCRRFEAYDTAWRMDGMAPVLASWRKRAAGIGDVIDARLPNETVRGVFADVDSEGALLLDLADGTRRQITAGAIYFADAGTV